MTQLTAQDIHTIRERLNKFLKENPSASNRTVAKEIGSSSSYVSLFRNDKFPTKETEIEFAVKIESFVEKMEKQRDEETRDTHLKFAPTESADKIFKNADYAESYHKIGVITGVEGCGRTFTLGEYKRRNPNSIFVAAYPYITPRSLLHDICTQLKIPVTQYKGNSGAPSYVPNHILFKQTIEKLYGTRRLMIFDECENFGKLCLEVIRRTHDFTGVGIVLSGTPILINRLQGQRRELRQLYSRVGMNTKVPTLNKEDVKAILRVNFPEAIRFAENFVQLSKNNGRNLENLIDLVRKTIRDTESELDDSLIDEAASELIISAE